MESRLVEIIVCPACGTELPPSASVCSRCGGTAAASETRCSSPVGTGSRQQAASETGIADGRSLLDRPWFILGLLFLVTAILGLPLLWISRGFSRPWKIALSVAVTLYTAALLWGFWLLMNWSLSRIMDSLR